MTTLSCLENSVNRGAWQAAVHGVSKSQAGLRMRAYAHTHTPHRPPPPTHTQPINNVVIVSVERQRDPAICVHVSILPQTPFPSRLSHNFPVLYSRSLLIIHFKYRSVYMSIPNSLTILSPHPSLLATISLFSKLVKLRNTL